MGGSIEIGGIKIVKSVSNSNKAYDLFIPPENKNQNNPTGFNNEDLLIITSNNLPGVDSNAIDAGNGVELLYEKTGDTDNIGKISWKTRSIDKTTGTNLSDPVLSLVTKLKENDNEYKIGVGTKSFFQQYINGNNSALIKAELLTGDITNDNLYNGSVTTINVINVPTGTDCRKLNKYYYSLNKNFNSKNLNVVKKESNDKEYDFIGGIGRKSSLVISNDMNLYNDNIHILLNENLYIKGIHNPGYLYKEGDILQINNDLFENLKFKVLKISNKKDKNILSFKNLFEERAENISDYSSFNFTINLIRYNQTLTDPNIINKNSKIDNETGLGTLIFDYEMESNDNTLIKNISINGILNKNSFLVFNLGVLNNRVIFFVKTNENKNVKIYKEFFYNNTSNNSLIINETYELNKFLEIEKE